MQQKALFLGTERIQEAGPRDRLASNNFSYREIAAGEEVNIHAGQQMIVINAVRVDGFLRIDGEMYVQEPQVIPEPIELPADNFSYSEIPSGKIVNIPATQQMYVRDHIRIDGFLRVEGQLSVGGAPLVEVDEPVPVYVEAGKLYRVKTNQEIQFRNFLRVDGAVRNDGFIAIGA